MISTLKKAFTKLQANNKLLTNQVLLYVMVFIAVFDIINSANNQDPTSVILLFLIGFLTSFFSKNMIVIIFIAVVLSNALKVVKRPGVEGMKNNKTKKSKKSKKDETNKDRDEEEKETTEDTEPLRNKGETMKEYTKRDNETVIKELEEEYPEFLKIQNQILENVEKMNPLLEKAESFVSKYSHLRAPEY
jgi:type III secretory pathway component EscV